MSGIIGVSPSMKSGVVGKYPSGHVLQYQYRQFNYGDHRSPSSSWAAHPDASSLLFTVIPKSKNSIFLFQYDSTIGHSSTGGGYGFMAFTKDGTGNRNVWEGGMTNYQDVYGHFGNGDADAGNYVPIIGQLRVTNSSLTSFVLSLDAYYNSGNWFYSHTGGFQTLSCTEYQA